MVRLAATPGWTDINAMHRNLLGSLWAGDTSWYGHKAAYEYDMLADFKALKPRTLILTNTGEDLYEISREAHRMRPDMAYAELTVFRDGNEIGKATYDALMGGGRMDKFIKADEKVRELVNQLFPG